MINFIYFKFKMINFLIIKDKFIYLKYLKTYLFDFIIFLTLKCDFINQLIF